MKIINKSKNNFLLGEVRVATSFKDRLIGLMFSHTDQGGLLIRPCNSIHTFFMNYSLDVAFLDSKYRVIKVIRNLSPCRITPIYFKAKMVLEMKAGSMPHLELGDELCLN
jgi:uncharacterized membrane protein (UPF0127 family)